MGRKHEHKVDYSPDRVTWYPQKVVSKELLRGYAIMNSMSMSEAIDKIINPVFNIMSEEEKERLRYFARDYK